MFQISDQLTKLLLERVAIVDGCVVVKDQNMQLAPSLSHSEHILHRQVIFPMDAQFTNVGRYAQSFDEVFGRFREIQLDPHVKAFESFELAQNLRMKSNTLTECPC